MSRPPIKVKAFAVLPNAAGDRHVVWRGHDDTKQPAAFHRLVGGHVEFGESTIEAVVREVREELGTDLLDPNLLGVLENRFTYHGRPGHEVVFLYSGRMSDPAVVPDRGCWCADNDEAIWVEWRPLDDRSLDIPLYPHGAAELFEGRVRANDGGPVGEVG